MGTQPSIYSLNIAPHKERKTKVNDNNLKTLNLQNYSRNLCIAGLKVGLKAGVFLLLAEGLLNNNTL